MSELYQIAYISKNVVPGTRQEIKAQLEDILKKAQINNAKLNITGALLYSGDHFCQVIEGGRYDVAQLFKTIQKDERHTDITMLSTEPVSKRSFSDWGMAFAGIEDTMRFNIYGAKHSKDEFKMQQIGKNLVHVLEQLIHHQEMLSNIRSSLDNFK